GEELGGNVGEIFHVKALTGIDYPDGTSSAYSYRSTPELEVTPPPPFDPGSPAKHTLHFHANLQSVTDKRGNEHGFSYTPNPTVEYLDFNGKGPGFYSPVVSLRELDERPFVQQKVAETL